MFMLVALRATALVAMACIVGCKVVDEPPQGRSPLLPLATSPDTITLEVFSAPAPVEDPHLAALWGEVNEQPLSPELRKRLAQNGLRAGIASARVSDSLAALLKVTDKPISVEERSQVPLETEPGVLLRVLQPMPGKRNELVVSPVQNEISLLRNAGGSVEGKTYKKAEGRLALVAFPESEGRVRLELTPELHHGEMKTQATGSDGMFIWKSERDKQTFSELKIEATLAAGEMLLVTCLDDRPSSVGHHFFVQKQGEKPVRRLWVLRVAQAGPDQAFADWAGDAVQGTAAGPPEEPSSQSATVAAAKSAKGP
jgi:hypothetical protein